MGIRHDQHAGCIGARTVERKGCWFPSNNKQVKSNYWINYQIKLTMAWKGCSPGSYGSTHWDGTIDPIDINNGSQAYLAVYNCSEKATPIFFSHYFNLTDATSSSSSETTNSASSSTSTISASSVTASSATVSSATATAGTNSAKADTSTATSNAAAVGGGVGGGVGGALLIIAGGFALWRCRKNRQGRQPVPTREMNNRDSMYPNYLQTSVPPSTIESITKYTGSHASSHQQNYSMAELD